MLLTYRRYQTIVLRSLVMNKLFFVIGIAFSFYVMAFTQAQAQFIITKCDRSTIEKYRGNEKQPVLRFFDIAKEKSDGFLKLLAGSKFAKVRNFNNNAETTVSVIRKSAIQGTPMSLSEFVKEYGQIISYKYQFQSILYNLTQGIELSGSSIYTIYAVKTKKSGGTPIYLKLETSSKTAKESPTIKYIYFKEGEKSVSEEKASECPFMPYGLMVKP